VEALEVGVVGLSRFRLARHRARGNVSDANPWLHMFRNARRYVA
jgi:hypothetical protein